MIQKLCSQTLFLHEGQVVYQGDTQEALDRYHTGFTGRALDAEVRAGGAETVREAQITRVELLDGSGEVSHSFFTGQPMVVRIHFCANAPLTDPVFYSRIRKGYNILHGTTTARFDVESHFEAGEEGIAEARYDSLNLLNGEYNVNVGIKRDHFSPFTLDQIDAAVRFRVGSRFDQGGALVHLPHRWHVCKTHTRRGNGNGT
jgi:ABC-2 type transport system ATP-binding protein